VAVEAALARPLEPLRKLTAPATVRDRWTAVEYRVAQARNQLASTWFGGDSIPSWFVNLGPGSVAACLGPEPDFTPDSLWFRQFERNGLADILEQIRFDPANPFWRLTERLTRRSLETAAGDYLISLTDLGGDLDILDSLRGTDNLLVDLLEEPELVEACRDKITGVWMKFFELNNRLFDQTGQNGYTCWMPCWSALPWTVLQCDLSVMIGPEMFERFVVPELEFKSSRIAHTIYHLDGPGEWPHLDLILGLQGIDAIQYVSLPGDPPNESLHWLSYYRRITEAGKNVFIIVRDPARIIELTRKLPAEQLAFQISLDSPDQAKRFLAALGG